MTGHRTRESNFGPPSSPRKGNFYGKLRRGIDAKRFRRNQAHIEALIEDEVRAARIDLAFRDAVVEDAVRSVLKALGV